MSSCAPLPAPAARNLAPRAITRRRRDGWLIVIRARYALCGTAERADTLLSGCHGAGFQCADQPRRERSRVQVSRGMEEPPED